MQRFIRRLVLPCFYLLRGALLVSRGKSLRLDSLVLGLVVMRRMRLDGARERLCSARCPCTIALLLHIGSGWAKSGGEDGRGPVNTADAFRAIDF